MTLEQAKERARKYIRDGDYDGAVHSMMSDLSKIAGRPELADLAVLGLAPLLFGCTKDSATKFVEGFN